MLSSFRHDLDLAREASLRIEMPNDLLAAPGAYTSVSVNLDIDTYPP